jgi:biopolymer transport protein ExbB
MLSDRISDLIVQGALALLVLFSVVTWAVVIVKGLQGSRARKQDLQAQKTLGANGALPSLEAIEKLEGPTARVAIAGVRAWESAGSGLTSHVAQVAVPREILELGLRRQIQKERHTTESGLAVLASIGTTSPFVGLFGTVWGILHALKSISSAGSASLDVVAGPIGEALVATGIGIAVAVPAVLAFNYFVRRLKVQAADLEDFANALVSSALQSTLPDVRPALSGERHVTKLSEARGGSLREAQA